MSKMSDIMIDVEDMVASGEKIDDIVLYIIKTLGCSKEYAEGIVKEVVRTFY